VTRRRTLADRFRWYWRFANWTESFTVRLFGTNLIGLIRRSPVLVIETTGRKTGRRRRAVVVYWTVGGAFFVGGGAGGMTRVDWVANVRAEPKAAVWVKRRRIPVVVQELTGTAEEDARRYAFARWGSDKYERRSGRRTPFFRLAPVS
jgi:deazaflavin-dependent oxidoreductase (nitroreductase family)